MAQHIPKILPHGEQLEPGRSVTSLQNHPHASTFTCHNVKIGMRGEEPI